MRTRHAAVQGAIARLGEVLRDAKLDALIVCGDDQNELYHHDNMPGILVYYGESIRNVPLAPVEEPNWGWRASARWYEEKAPRDYPVNAALARHLIDELIDREFDLAASDAVPDGEGEGHAVGFVHKRIMQEWRRTSCRSCRSASTPTTRRTSRRRGAATGSARRSAPRSNPIRRISRVGIIGSGGLSHFVVDEELDRGLLDMLKGKDAAGIASLPREKLNSGSSEIRNWIAVAGAVEHLSLEWSLYEPGYRTPAGTGTGLGFAYWA